MRALFLLLWLIPLIACAPAKRKVPLVGFVDALVDETLAEARKGFFQALADSGYSEEQKTLRVLYRNAQNDLPTLTQIVDYYIAQQVDLIATCPSVATIAACQKTRTIPVCMMVSPSPADAGLLDAHGNPPSNLFGVYEETWYIDTSLALIRQLLPQARRVGAIFNQAEPQSRNALRALEQMCAHLGLELVALPVNNSSESKLVLETLLAKGIDVFFAPPDNTVFASFPAIINSCQNARVPVFTSEAGLVKAGAVAAYGADLYAWGYQAGQQAARFFRQGSLQGLGPQLVNKRVRVYNPSVARQYGIEFPKEFIPLQ
ncbi:MAG: ABC transporter substrate-binding protein [Chitinophagales bacterium]|nr:ABC transporter substrate-binding protein [Chitinophagales bacterium]MDW8428316.1 ABC transporter substrate-binding protein [Chitinophagales bacterium]